MLSLFQLAVVKIDAVELYTDRFSCIKKNKWTKGNPKICFSVRCNGVTIPSPEGLTLTGWVVVKSNPGPVSGRQNQASVYRENV